MTLHLQLHLRGLTALGIIYLAYRLMERAAVEQAWAVWKPMKMLDQGRTLAVPPSTPIGPGTISA